VQDGEGVTELGLTEEHGDPGVTGTRTCRREHVSNMQPRRLLAPDPPFHEAGTMPTDDRGRLTPSRWSAIPARPRRNPRGAGYDVCCHGCAGIKHFDLTPKEEREQSGRLSPQCRRPWEGHTDGTAATAPRGTPAASSQPRADSSTTAITTVEEFAHLAGRSRAKGHLVIPDALTNNDGKYAVWVGHVGEQWFSSCASLRHAAPAREAGSRR